jgi:hypothetical protein
MEDVCGQLAHLGVLHLASTGVPSNPDAAFLQQLWSAEVRSVLSGSGLSGASQTTSTQGGAATTQTSAVGAASNSFDSTSQGAQSMPMTQLHHA